jgi:hypothetical protein
MKKLLTLTALIGATTVSFAQGTVNFANTAATLISAGGVAMGGSSSNQFNFAVFLAPSSTAGSSGLTAALTDPAFQSVAGVNANGATPGRLTTKSGYAIGSTPGTVVDYIVRGWSANAGATWAEALASYNSGVLMYIGSSTIGNDLTLGGGAIPATSLFGAGANQVTGFNMVQVIPEPTSMVLACLGAEKLMNGLREKMQRK